MEVVNPVLEGKFLNKRFEGVLAVDDVTIALDKGDIVGLVGENGAGKSTLAKLLVGEHKKDRGVITCRGKEVHWTNPFQALIDGVGLVHQRPCLVPELTAAENIFLGKEYTRNGLISSTQIHKNAKKLLEKYLINPSFDLHLRAGEMSAGQREITEILKVLSYDPEILILDEPTASLTKDESENFLSIVKKINHEKKISIIFVSHRLEEVFDISTKIIVLRNGKRVGSVTRENFNKKNIIHMIINKDLSEFYPPKSESLGEPLLEIEKFNSEEIKNINMVIHKGEIVGLYGLSGAGMTEVVESIFGVRKVNEGWMKLQGRTLKNVRVQSCIDNKIYLVPEDRDVKGLFSNFSVGENMIISHLKKLIKSFLIYKREEKKIVEKGINEYNIVCANMNQEIHSLSGGNQQKVVIAKWLLKDCDVLILDDPTVGVDIGTKREIYVMLRELTKKGKGILLVSSDILEIIGMADRIYTLREGSISSELIGNDINQGTILENVL